MEKLNKKVMNDLYDRETRENDFYAVEDSDAGTSNDQQLPDAKLHQRISFIKSAIRLGACAFGFFGFFELGFILLFLAEIVGIGEELV
jgi:hypothetical protein|tara:strand:- start:14 stop:277 length:264 start_codon:yes stop_codon:yes gene_type:complete